MIWQCPNCIQDWEEPYCGWCSLNLVGKTLKEPEDNQPPDGRSDSGSSSVSPYLRLLNNIARDDWNRCA